MNELHGKVALVAGAGGSIGRAIGRRFAERGAAVALADLDQAAALDAARETPAPENRVLALSVDVTSLESTAGVVGETIERFGRLDILVNCAAAEIPRSPAIDLDPDAWRLAVDVNLTGSFLLCRAAIPPMIDGGGGAVILVGSQLGHVGAAGRAAYCASKGGVLQLARTLALEHAEHGIRVNTLSPGAVLSERLRRHYGTDEAAESALGPRHPVGRLGRPDEIASAALFLASDECTFMTGADLLVDGGYTAV